MENPEKEKEGMFLNQWKPIPSKDFFKTLDVGQYVFSKRSSPKVIAARAGKRFFEMAEELNRSIDKLVHQPGGGDHGALEWIWKRLERKIIKKFDLYMKVVDKRQLLTFPKNASVIDVSPAFGLLYSKVVQVPLIDGIVDNPAPEVVMADQVGEAASQLETKGLEQNEKADSPPEPEVKGDPGLEHDGKAEIVQGVRLVGCNIIMPRLEEMIEPEAMAVYWQKYKENWSPK